MMVARFSLLEGRALNAAAGGVRQASHDSGGREAFRAQLGIVAGADGIGVGLEASRPGGRGLRAFTKLCGTASSGAANAFDPRCFSLLPAR